MSKGCQISHNVHGCELQPNQRQRLQSNVVGLLSMDFSTLAMQLKLPYLCDVLKRLWNAALHKTPPPRRNPTKQSRQQLGPFPTQKTLLYPSFSFLCGCDASFTELSFTCSIPICWIRSNSCPIDFRTSCITPTRSYS